MAEILSQKDLDALILSLTTSDERKTADKGAHGSAYQKHLVRVYDFNRPDKFSRDQIRTVEMLHDNIARLATTYLAAQIRAMVSIVVASVDQMNFEEFISSLPNPCYVASINLSPLKGNMFVSIDIPVALAMVDRLFGGPGTPPTSLRPLTEIEVSIVDRLLRGIIPTIGESWASIIALEPKIEVTTSNPTFIQNVPSNEMTVVVRFDVKVGKGSGAITFCLPFVSIEPILPKLSAQNWFTVLRREQSESEDEQVIDRLTQMDVTIVARLGQAQLTVKEVLSLEPGDVIQLESRLKDPIEIHVEDHVKFLAKPGRLGQRSCCKVLKVLREDETLG